MNFYRVKLYDSQDPSKCAGFQWFRFKQEAERHAMKHPGSEIEEVFSYGTNKVDVVYLLRKYANHADNG